MASKTGQGSGKRPPKFIYELPYTVTRDLVELLNINDAWETLAGEHLQLRQTEISKFRRYDQQPNNSAGNALWDLLSTRNTTIQDMFGLLHRVQVYRGLMYPRASTTTSAHNLTSQSSNLINPRHSLQPTLRKLQSLPK
jgi:hypothetical protein